jgi:hypothetical protein
VNAVLARAEKRRKRALQIVDELDLIGRWSQYGRPVVVGSVSHGLVVAPDIDMEVCAEDPQIAHGFEVMAQVAESSNVVRIEFKNDLGTRGKWLYWEVHYRDEDGVVWTIETYFCGPGDPYAHFSERLTENLKKALTEEHRLAILTIKEALCERGLMDDTKSTDICRAVIDDGIRSVDAFLEWIESNKSEGIVEWTPRAGGSD